jgi:hypothetical protein
MWQYCGREPELITKVDLCANTIRRRDPLFIKQKFDRSECAAAPKSIWPELKNVAVTERMLLFHELQMPRSLVYMLVNPAKCVYYFKIERGGFFLNT